MIMKRYLYVIAALLVAACGKPLEPEKPETKVSVSAFPTTLSFTSEGTESSTVTVSATGEWTASKSAAWITVSPSSGTGNASVTVTAGYNSGEAREGTITFQDKARTVSAEVKVRQEGYTSPPETPETNIVPSPQAFDGTKRSSTTYQLLIYTFADSNGDGVGDFKGIQNKLDYLDGLGVTALWLSPAQKTSSYHGYDVDDYFALNPLFGTEQDFKNLIDAAHGKGIKIYMDYVLNHTGLHNNWFTTAVSSVSNEYSDYFVLSENPDADLKAGKLDNFAGQTSYNNMGSWTQITGGEAGYKGRLHFKVDMNDKTVTVTKTNEAAQSPNKTNPAMWLWYGAVTSHVGMYTTGDKVYEITLDFDSDWGFLVCSKTDWSGGSKYGSQNSASIEFGKPFPLYNNANNDLVKNVTFGGYTTYYFGAFGSWMPDLNYGPYSSCEESAAFKATVESAKKWIDMGVDGFRLDAVVWIYQAKHEANVRFLDQWYKAVNKAYKDAGHSDDIFMVGEAWCDNHGAEKMYYKGLPSNFEFDYAGMLSDVLNNGKGSNYASTVIGYINDHAGQRSDAITSLFFTNHDQDRWSEWVGKSMPRQKQAAAMLLTSAGKPFIYMGEELGYTGKRTGDSDIPRRMPMAWDNQLSDLAKYGLDDSHKYDNTDYSIVKGSVSVAAQEADAGSLLNVYKTWSRLRNTYPALAEGTMTVAPVNAGSIAAWYMTSGNQKLLVIHNTASTAKAITVQDDISRAVALLGTASIKQKTLTIGPNSSVVFNL